MKQGESDGAREGRDKPISLAPLSLEAALGAAMQVPLPPKKPKPVKKRKPKKK